MRLFRDAIGVSKLFLILLLLISAIVGAVLSYVWTEGYYQSLGVKLPETATLTITNVIFDPQDPTFFNVTLLNPSFSPSSVRITQIETSTAGGVLHIVEEVNPPLLYELEVSESETFKCFWNWANYTGEDIRVYIFVAEGSGSNLEAKVPLVKLTVTDVVFNSTISPTQFKVTVQNSPSSATYVDVTEITVSVNETIAHARVTNLELPYMLDQNSTATFMCEWNWTAYQGMSVVITAHTLQRFEISSATEIPEG